MSGHFFLFRILQNKFLIKNGKPIYEQQAMPPPPPHLECTYVFNPLRQSAESCSDFQGSFIYLFKKYLILYLDFLSHTVKKLLAIL
jgi:hypothetical protein